MLKNNEKLNSLLNKNSKLNTTRKQTAQHLDKLQPKRRHIDVYTKVLTINYLDRVYESVSMEEQEKM